MIKEMLVKIDEWLSDLSIAFLKRIGVVKTKKPKQLALYRADSFMSFVYAAISAFTVFMYGLDTFVVFLNYVCLVRNGLKSIAVTIKAIKRFDKYSYENKQDKNVEPTRKTASPIEKKNIYKFLAFCFARSMMYMLLIGAAFVVLLVNINENIFIVKASVYLMIISVLMEENFNNMLQAYNTERG